MTGARSPYRRLPGCHRHLMGHATLWLGADHLLLVRLYGFTETYERFYFRDIQSLTVRVTDSWSLWNVAFGLPAVLVGVLAAGATTAAGRIGWGSIAAVLLAAFLTSVLRGPTCVSHLRTPLRLVELTSLRRLRLARRALARLRPPIEAAQGLLDAEIVRARLLSGEPAAAPPAPSAPPAAGTDRTGARPLRRDNGRAHEILWLLLVADTVLTAFQLAPETALLDVAALLLLVVQFGFAVAAVARQKDSDIEPGLRHFAWASLGYLCGMTLLGFGVAMIQSVRTAMAGGSPSAVLRVTELQLLSLVCTSTLSLWGFVQIRRRREARRRSWLNLAT